MERQFKSKEIDGNLDREQSFYVDTNFISKTQIRGHLYFFLKRCMDIAGALVGIIITLLVIIPFFLCYQIGDNKGPMFFKQKRMGQNGQLFYIYKFRSMVIDAEKKLKENKRLYKKYLANNFKLEQDEDPRITKFGRFIRRTSLDELPQFFNVLLGDMSLVGPRPVIEEELQEYKEYQSAFLSAKPGMTGYWQAGGRSDVGYPERVDIEMFYITNQSLSLDIKILFKTITEVLGKRGAY